MQFPVPQWNIEPYRNPTIPPQLQLRTFSPNSTYLLTYLPMEWGTQRVILALENSHYIASDQGDGLKANGDEEHRLGLAQVQALLFDVATVVVEEDEEAEKAGT